MQPFRNLRQEIAASAQELPRTAEHLQQLVGRFTLSP
jgi:methyl-accepting chemotaxis protein